MTLRRMIQLVIKALSQFAWVTLFCSTPSESYFFIIPNPVLHTGLLKFDYFHASPSAMQDTVVVLEQRRCPAKPLGEAWKLFNVNSHV